MSFGILTALGMAVFGGLIGAWIFQKIRFPQVVGYIIIGLIIGEAGFKLVSAEDVAQLKQINLFALGIIGFLVGGELKLETFRKYAKQFTSILLFEGCLAFLLVGGAVFALVAGLTHNYPVALATGIIFGAIASATDPASTIDVIWEYRAAGAVTTATIAIVALDDALAMTLYGLGTGTAQLLTASDSNGILRSLLRVVIELFGSLGIGAVFALILMVFLRQIGQPERGAALSIGIILLAIGLINFWNMDIILCTMTIGFILVNAIPRRSEKIFALMHNFSIPLYVLFFVLVGARLNVQKMPPWLWLVVLIYLVGRNAGKVIGCYWGGKVSGAPASVCKYMGLGIFAQGGVAIGLSIVAGDYLQGITIGSAKLPLCDMIVYVVTATTLVLQLFGPPMVKLGLKLAGETGKNVTEEDVMQQMIVQDVVNPDVPVLRENDSLATAVEAFADADSTICPVVDGANKVIGILNFDSLKSVLADHDAWAWLLAVDVMEPVQDFVHPGDNLLEAFRKLNQLQLDHVVVLTGADGKESAGILLMRQLRQKVQTKLLRTKGNL